MLYIEKDKLTTDDFHVLDENNNPVTGLTIGDLTVELYNPDGDEVANTSGGTLVEIDEVGNGFYKISFTPTTLGNWVLVVYHSTHFPYGKGENYNCLELIAGQNTKDLIERILGLSQENYRVFNQRYDNKHNMVEAIIKIYPSANDCDNDTNAIAEYQMQSTWNKKNELTGYKVTKS